MPDSAWQRTHCDRRPPPDDLHDTRGHRRVPYFLAGQDGGEVTFHCISCRTPWPCPDVATRMQTPLTRDELTELERRITTRDGDPIAPHRAAGYAWDTALELFCAYVALQRDHDKALMRVTALQDLLDAERMEAS